MGNWENVTMLQSRKLPILLYDPQSIPLVFKVIRLLLYQKKKKKKKKRGQRIITGKVTRQRYFVLEKFFQSGLRSKLTARECSKTRRKTNEQRNKQKSRYSEETDEGKSQD